MANTIITEANQMLERCKALTHEIGMLRQAHGHLRGIPQRHNTIRINERTEELTTLLAHLEIIARFGADEIAHCEVA